MKRTLIRRNTLFKTNISPIFKADRVPTKDEVDAFRHHLLKSKWRITDDVVSNFPAKQLFVTNQSLLSQDQQPYMDQLNEGVHTSTMKSVNHLFKIGDPVPPGYSLAYCNPLSNEKELSSDGYDNYHAPLYKNSVEFFNRRMWVSGSFVFNKNNPLKFGDKLEFTETVQRVRTLQKGNLIFADYKRLFENNNDWCIAENRSLCYLRNTFEKKDDEIRHKDFPAPDESITFTPSLISNFRMSALTFNAHQIHYNPVYAREIEKYPAVVIEAPLLVSLALQFWSNIHPSETLSIHSFQYKIMSPSFVDETITMNLKRNGDVDRIWIIKGDSSVVFDSTLKF